MPRVRIVSILLAFGVVACGEGARETQRPSTDAGVSAPDTGTVVPADAGDAGEADAGHDAGSVAVDAGEPDAGSTEDPVWREEAPGDSETSLEGDADTLGYTYAFPPASAEARLSTRMFHPDLVRVRFRTTADTLTAYVDDTEFVLRSAEPAGQGQEARRQVLLDLAYAETLAFVVGGGRAAEDGTIEGTLSVTIEPWTPAIDEFDLTGRYLKGVGALPLGDGTVLTYNLHVQRVRKVDGAWTNEPLTYDDGRSPREVLHGSAGLWVTLYRALIARGTARSEILKLAQGIRSEASDSGVYIETDLSACGYNGGARTITCGSGTGNYLKGTMAHESFHGWEFLTFDSDPARSIAFRDAFSRYANLVHHTRRTEPEKLQGEGWRLDYLNYGLQNSIEWGSEMFRDWLLGIEGGGWPGNWQFTSRYAPEFATYFDCLLLDGDDLLVCQQRAFGSTPLIARPELRPEDTLVSVTGFSAADSEAIWKVCRGTADAATYTERFDALVRRVAPDLPGSPAASYRLAVGDCNHDGIEDWLCWYTGRGPTGLGNGDYLWNSANTEGAYTFVVSGKIGDAYAEYMQDPFLTLPSINGSLAQPMFREWQGQFGSCNGALRFDPLGDAWRRAYFGTLLE